MSATIFRRSCVSARAVILRRTVASTAFLLSLLASIPVAVVFSGEMAARLAVPVVFVLMPGVCVVMALGYVRHQLTWMDDDHCAELAALCDRNPPLAQYRDMVVVSRRRFTTGEYLSMKAWARVQERRAEIKRAYAAAEGKVKAQRRSLYGDIEL
ncbi:hypothetical protein [Paraburkholderia sp. A3RO-2L]|jgi:hypothetical protein|uniref:hypothetical protein n=1 Tax=Paraburkholderia sp. A3RO-2L TaxID=3028376 RepID=UPI003DA7F0E8